MAGATTGEPDFWEPLDLVRRARTASAESAWGLLDGVLAKAGFEQSFYAYGVPMTAQQPLLEKFKRGIFGGGRFVSEFFPELASRPDLLATDPVAPHCKRSLRPFVWTCAQPVHSGILKFAVDFGFSSFVVFPLRNGDGSHYGNFTVYCADARHKSWLRHAQRLAPLLHVTAQYFHDTLSGMDAERLELCDVTLSPRQRECLLWASRGLSGKQIAERIKLSEPVVHEYLGAAKRKLGCTTRAHAVARAMRLGLIEP
jgi:DNA-binding CsgD family transcriptional regulator